MYITLPPPPPGKVHRELQVLSYVLLLLVLLSFIVWVVNVGLDLVKFLKGDHLEAFSY